MPAKRSFNNVDPEEAGLLADIKETGRIAKVVETEMERVISNLDILKETYEEKYCDNNIADPECDSLRQQIESAYYNDLLSILSNHLPQILDNIENTRKGLEKQLRNNIGKGMTAGSLQDMLISSTNKKADQGKQTSRSRRNRNSRTRLSDRFKQYHRLVSSHAGANGESLTLAAADIYLDMVDSKYLIEITQQEIQRMSIISELNSSMGPLSPEIEEVVSGVKVILFGEDYSDTEFIPEAPQRMADGTNQYRSPFEQ